MGLQSVEGEVYEFDCGVEKIGCREDCLQRTREMEEGIGGEREKDMCGGWYIDLGRWVYGSGL